MVKRLSILVVDDDVQVLKNIARGLSRAGFEVSAHASGQSAFASLREHPYDAVICDLMMPEIDGLEVLRFCATLRDPPPFLMLTAHGSVQAAVEAMKLGAADFIEKPASTEMLRAAIYGVLDRQPQHGDEADPFQVYHLVGSDRWLKPFREMLRRVAQTEATVLIEGETGTGKSAVARALWRASKRASRPFVEINCAAIPAALMEIELFGHAESALTGATGLHGGRVKQASGGTLFLDAVGELKPELQAKLLHLLQNRRFTPVGGTQVQEADVRFIAATNRDLHAEVQRGCFRADLFYRLNVVGLTIPPLRERMDDLPLLIDHFRQLAAKRMGVPEPTLNPATRQALSRYTWPGNVRELENMVQRIAVLSAGQEVKPEHLDPRIREAVGMPEPASSPPTARTQEAANGLPLTLEPDETLSDAIRNYERALIVEALRTHKGNKTHAAKELRTKRTTLIEKCRKLDIDASDWSEA